MVFYFHCFGWVEHGNGLSLAVVSFDVDAIEQAWALDAGDVAEWDRYFCGEDAWALDFETVGVNGDGGTD